MKYSTFKKWEPVIQLYERSGGGNKLAFCQKNNLSHYQFCAVMRAVKYGLITPPSSGEATDIPAGSPCTVSLDDIVFLKVRIVEDVQ